MMLSAFKNYFRTRLQIIGANLSYSWQLDTAYFANNWLSVLSMVMVTFTNLILAEAIYSNVDDFVGYSYNQMLFLFFIGHLSFQIRWVWSEENIRTLAHLIAAGELDLILLRPIPALFFVTFRYLNTLKIIQEGLPSLAIYAYLINWGELNIGLSNILIGIIVFILGQIAIHSLQFALVSVAFWQGSDSDILYHFTRALIDDDIPLEALPNSLKYVLTSLFPVLVSTAVVTSVILGKSDIYFMLLLSIIVAIFFTMLKYLVWKLGLKSYSSASS